MDEQEIWLSEEEDEEEGDTANPTCFSLALALQDQPGGKRHSHRFRSHRASLRLGQPETDSHQDTMSAIVQTNASGRQSQLFAADPKRSPPLRWLATPKS